MIKECGNSQSSPFISASTSSAIEELRIAVNQFVIAELIKMDCNVHPVPLDLWLCIGEIVYMKTNPFNIIADTNPSILNLPIDNVRSNSDYLKKESILKYAEKYIKAGAKYADVVKKWVRGASAEEDDGYVEPSGPVRTPVINVVQEPTSSPFAPIKNEAPSPFAPIPNNAPSPFAPIEQPKEEEEDDGKKGGFFGFFKKK